MTPATRRYKAHADAVNNHEVNTLTGRDTGRNTRRDTQRNTQRDTWRTWSHREAMSEVPPVFSRIRNSIVDYLNGLYECIIYCDPGEKAKGGPLTYFQSEF